MTEIAEQWHETTEGFASLAGTLQEESVRLASIAEACRTKTQELAEWEGRLAGWEHELGDRQRGLDARAEELERWRHELDEIAAQSEQAGARIADAAEREAALKSLAQSILDRYADTPAPANPD